MRVPVILNVDDHEPGRYARSRILRAAGYEVHEASSGGEALQFSRLHCPALVLLDVHLPDIDGLEVCRRIKADPITAKTLVLQLSAFAITPAKKAEGLDSGADSYLTEPVDPEVLLATVRALLRIREAEDELEQANESLMNANSALAVANAALVRSNEDLQRFAYLASHDLQEPLRTVSSFATLLRRRYVNKLDSDGETFLEHIMQGTNRMSALIQGLLIYAQSGRDTQHEWREVDSQAVLNWALKNLENAVGDSRAEITHGSLATVRGDQMQLAQLFQNVISNGIKYCRPEESPKVHITSEPQDGKMVLFSVRDNGIGIPPEYHERIFAPFQRLHGQNVPGTGIGLATCQRIVENHGGRIWVESNDGQGATFRFSLQSA